jgi:hypothetical protein
MPPQGEREDHLDTISFESDNAGVVEVPRAEMIWRRYLAERGPERGE